MASSLVRPVEYAEGLDGKLIAVTRGPHKGWAVGDEVFSSFAEANAAAGRLNQRSYIAEQIPEIEYGIGQLVSSASPFASCRRKYDDYERERDLVEEIVRGLFPNYGWKRSEHAQRFADAFVLANEAYEELHKS